MDAVGSPGNVARGLGCVLQIAARSATLTRNWLLLSVTSYVTGRVIRSDMPCVMTC